MHTNSAAADTMPNEDTGEKLASESRQFAELFKFMFRNGEMMVENESWLCASSSL